jgi:hypothetical protein
MSRPGNAPKKKALAKAEKDAKAAQGAKAKKATAARKRQRHARGA